VAHLYLLAEPDFPFVQDGFRDGEKIRDWMNGRFAEALVQTGVRVLALRGSEEARHSTALAAIEELVATCRVG